MRILICPNSFKGSCTSIDVCHSIARGIRRANPGAKIIEMPIADGGLGTVEILTKYLKGRFINTMVTGASGRTVKAKYSIVPSKKIAIIELAQSAGLHLVPENLRNPLKTTTTGVGELIINSIKKNCKRVIIGVGDSATIDCGIGAMSAMGIRFLDRVLKPVEPNCLGLLSLNKIDDKILKNKFKTIKFTVLTDVSNILTGKNGAIVYASQKGAKKRDLYLIEQALKNFKRVIIRHYGIDLDRIKGSGAAGGIAGGMYAILKAKIVSGFDFFKKITHLENHIKMADLIITGEGMIDKTTFYGKATGEIINICKKYQKPVIIVCGDSPKKFKLEIYGVSKIYTLTEIVKNRNTAIHNAKNLLYKIGYEIGTGIILPKNH
jgi:glycerate kinase|uniref:Glycerate kinase n=1 Tax=candidate division WOR-3 bacterium TaxID=2052148 RepID=A0A7C4TC57_UNCW3